MESLMTKNTLSEKGPKSQSINTDNNKDITTVRVETNFEKLPIWSPKPKRGSIFAPSKTIELKPERLSNGNIVERKIEIIPSAKYGYPTVHAQEYWLAVQHMWSELESNKVKANGVVEFSRRGVLVGILGKRYGKKQVSAFELGIGQLASTLFRLEYAFFDKERDELCREIRGFSLITDYYLTSREKERNIVKDKCSVTLHNLIVSNLLAGYYKPVLLSVVSKIKSDLARILYRKLDFQFSHYSKYEISTKRFFDEHALSGSEYHKPSIRKRLLERAIKEIIGLPTSSGSVITNFKFQMTARGTDWKLLVFASKEKAILVNSKRIKQENPQVQIISKNIPRPTDPPSLAALPEADKLLHYFAEVFKGGHYIEPPLKVQNKAKEIVDRIGLEKAKYLVFYAKQNNKKDYIPQTFNGIVHLLDSALHSFEQKRNKSAETPKSSPQKTEKSTQQKTSLMPELEGLVSYFIEKFHDARVSYQPSQEFVELYTNRIEKYGFQRIKGCINICRDNAERDRYRVKTLEGIEKYFLEALSHLEHQDKLRSQDKQKNIKAAIAKRKQGRKESRMKDYAAFLRQWLAGSTEAKDAYYDYEAKKLKEYESQLNPSTRLYAEALKKVHKVFNLDRHFVARVEKFFSTSTAKELSLAFPDFERWDKENPLKAVA